MDYRTILYEVAEGVARITLNRPEKRNSINGLMRRELRHAVESATLDARVILLTGAGEGFCAGQDLGDAENMADVDLQGVLRDEYEPLLQAMTEASIPVIAAVNGAAAGAGANLALAADVVVAARSAVFIEAFARIGLIPDAGGTYWLPRLIGLPRAMGMCLFAEPISAGRAAEWGLIWEVVEDDQLDARAGELAARLARGPGEAYARAKHALRAGLDNDLQTQLALEAQLQGETGRTRDFLEGVTAFLEKRDPDFEGR